MPIKIQPYFELQVNEPKMHLVSVLSYEHVSWEFCMRILTQVFHKSYEDAKTITHEIQTRGEGLCGGYMFEIAESKAETVEKLAEKENFTVQCLIEKV